MVVLTLRRNAPEAAKLGTCGLCGRADPEGVADHLLAGQPGTTGRECGLCRTCGDVLADAARTFGPDLTLMVQQDDRRVDKAVGTPQATGPGVVNPAGPAPAGASAARSGVGEARQHLQQEARALAHAERSLRAEADRLGRVEKDLP